MDGIAAGPKANLRQQEGTVGIGVSSWLRPFWDLLRRAGQNVVSCGQGISSGGRHRLPRETPFAKVFFHRERRADRRESRRADRFAGERAEPARVLSGHDESFS